jgi:hypothetical protein
MMEEAELGSAKGRAWAPGQQATEMTNEAKTLIERARAVAGGPHRVG